MKTISTSSYKLAALQSDWTKNIAFHINKWIELGTLPPCKGLWAGPDMHIRSSKTVSKDNIKLVLSAYNKTYEAYFFSQHPMFIVKPQEGIACVRVDGTRSIGMSFYTSSPSSAFEVIQKIIDRDNESEGDTDEPVEESDPSPSVYSPEPVMAAGNWWLKVASERPTHHFSIPGRDFVNNLSDGRKPSSKLE